MCKIIKLFRLSSDVFPWTTTTTTISPVAAEQVRFQQDYAKRTLVDQQNAIIRSRQRPLSQPTSPQFQIQPSSISQRQQIPFLDPNGQVRQQDFLPQQQNSLGTQVNEPFSYAQVQFGPAPETVAEQQPIVVARPKGQRSVSRSKINNAVEPIAQQTADYSATTAVSPIQLTARLLQNVVYIQPNGQQHKSVEDVEPVVHIPRRINQYQFDDITSSPIQTSAPLTVSSKTTTTTAVPIEEQPVIIIPRPKKPSQRLRPQEARNPGGIQQQFEAVKTERFQQQKQHQTQQIQQYQNQQHDDDLLQYQDLQQQQNLRQNQNNQQPYQLSSEVEPDNFLTSLLSRFRQQHHQQETTASPVPTKVRGSQRSKNGNRGTGGPSKYLADRNQLQLLQFPHELKSLSSAELKKLEEVAATAEIDERRAGQRQLQRNQPVTHSVVAAATSQPKLAPKTQVRPSTGIAGNRPVPTPVELNEQQRQFLAAQGIRHLYRVDYDQSGNPLPLTYVLALDSRPKRRETEQNS